MEYAKLQIGERNSGRISGKFCTEVAITDVITCTDFVDSWALA